MLRGLGIVFILEFFVRLFLKMTFFVAHCLIKFDNFLKTSIWPIDRILAGHGNEGAYNMITSVPPLQKKVFWHNTAPDGEAQTDTIIIMSCRQHGYPWPSLATSPYHSSPSAGLQGYILCLHIAAVCRFELVVLLLLGHMWGSIGVHHLRARPCLSSSVLRVWSNLYSFRDGRQVAV